jgi:hypothetical protein
LQFRGPLFGRPEMQTRAEQKNDWLVDEPFKDHKHADE